VAVAAVIAAVETVAAIAAAAEIGVTAAGIVVATVAATGVVATAEREDSKQLKIKERGASAPLSYFITR
jgi:hypothetical protein